MVQVRGLIKKQLYVERHTLHNVECIQQTEARLNTCETMSSMGNNQEAGDIQHDEEKNSGGLW